MAHSVQLAPASMPIAAEPSRLFTWRALAYATALLAATIVGMVLHAPTAMSLILSLAAIVVLAAPHLPVRRRRWSETLRTQLMIALALSAVLHAFGPEVWKHGTTKWIRGWSVFHYYLGAEYFTELGYDDLYDAALAADAERPEGTRRWDGVATVRNLATYEAERRAVGAARYRPAEHFSPARWDAFKADVIALQPYASRTAWRDIFRDRGYNPSPFWTAAASQLTHVLQPTSPWALKLLTSLDYGLFALAFWLIGRTFGVHALATVLVFFSLAPGNDGRLAGGFLQYDWFCAIAAGLCWMKRGRPVLSAAALAYATMARAFPLAFVVSALVPAAFALLRRRGLDRSKTLGRSAGVAPAVSRCALDRSHCAARDQFAVRFATAFVLCCGLGFAIGSSTGRGVAAWGEFAERIDHHSEHHIYGGARVGLKFWFTHDQLSVDLDGDEADRRETFAAQRPLYYAAAALFLAAYAVSVLRRRRTEALLLGMLPIFVSVVASRYYWAFLALLPCLRALGPPAARRLARIDLRPSRSAGVTPKGLAALADPTPRLGIDLLQAAGLAAYYLYSLIADPSAYAAYTVLNAALIALFAVWCVGCIRWDLAVWRRARRIRLRRAKPID